MFGHQCDFLLLHRDFFFLAYGNCGKKISKNKCNVMTFSHVCLLLNAFHFHVHFERGFVQHNFCIK